MDLSLSSKEIPFGVWNSPFRRRRFPLARRFVPFDGGVSLSRVDLSLSTAKIPFRARICPFRRRRFPFARGVVPFGEGDSLSRVDLSLSTAKIPFRKQISPFQRQTPFKKSAKMTMYLTLIKRVDSCSIKHVV